MSIETLTAKYLGNTQNSARLAERARRIMPGGDTHGHFYNPPYHITIDHGKGNSLYDVDGNQYLDCVNSYYMHIHGHCFAPIVEALDNQLQSGTGFGMPTEVQIEFAEHLCQWVPSLDEIRFVSSGSEATSMAIRAARAFTGKQKIVKLEGGYHGNHNIGEINSFGGSLDREELKISPEIGCEGSELNDVILFRFNDTDQLREIAKVHSNEIAALIIEPFIIPSGSIPFEPGFLQTIRDITREANIVLIFDEVVTLPFEYGGLQKHYGVIPDLTTIGKGIGGGLPIGAWGGRKEIMELWNPERGDDAVLMVSTSAGNPMSMIAGLTAMRHLTPELIEQRNMLGQCLRKGMNQAFNKAGIHGQVTGTAHSFWVHWSDQPVRNPHDVGMAISRAGDEIRNLLFLGMRHHGVYLFPSPSIFGHISTAMQEADIDTIIKALEQTLFEIKPFIKSESGLVYA